MVMRKHTKICVNLRNLWFTALPTEKWANPYPCPICNS